MMSDIPMFYGLDGHKPFPMYTTEEYIGWRKQHPLEDISWRRVGLTDADSCSISTVFLMMDHGMLDGSPPVLFETMVFCDHEVVVHEHDLQMERYCTWDTAEEGHAVMVASVMADLLMLNSG